MGINDVAVDDKMVFLLTKFIRNLKVPSFNSATSKTHIIFCPFLTNNSVAWKWSNNMEWSETKTCRINSSFSHWQYSAPWQDSSFVKSRQPGVVNQVVCCDRFAVVSHHPERVFNFFAWLVKKYTIYSERSSSSSVVNWLGARVLGWMAGYLWQILQLQLSKRKDEIKFGWEKLLLSVSSFPIKQLQM